MLVYQVLIAAQFHGRVTSDGFETVAGTRIIEGVGVEVEHAVVEALVLQNLFLPRLNPEIGLTVFGFDEIIIVKEAFVHRYHIHQY